MVRPFIAFDPPPQGAVPFNNMFAYFYFKYGQKQLEHHDVWLRQSCQVKNICSVYSKLTVIGEPQALTSL